MSFIPPENFYCEKCGDSEQETLYNLYVKHPHSKNPWFKGTATASMYSNMTVCRKCQVELFNCGLLYLDKI